MFIRNRFIVLFLATVFAVAATPATSSEQQQLPEHFSAFAVTTGGPLTPAGAGQVDITVTRWSTEEETARFLTALKKGGHEALIDEFQDVEPVGTIRSPASLGYDLRYAHSEDLGDGMRRIVLATDRPMSFYETVNQPRSADYPFTFIELRVDAQGRGQGQLAIASALAATRNGKSIQVYNYDTQPIQLNEVRRVDR
jgi:hypothetical protein